jgi:DNA repair exonuclease SbcCD ATPase subunit
LKLLSVHLQGFLSHKDSYLPLADRGLVLVEGRNLDRGGSNGSGKTALLEAIFWGLYGKTIRDIPVTQIAYRGTGRATVTVEVEVGNDKAVITRWYEEKSPKLKFTINGNSVEAGTYTETQNKLTKFLGMDRDVFANVVLFPSNGGGFASLTDKGQKGVLESLLGLQRFHNSLTALNTIKTERLARHMTLEAELLQLTQQLERREKHLVTLRTEEKAWLAKRQDRVKVAREAANLIEAKEPKLSHLVIEEYNETRLAAENNPFESKRRELSEKRNELTKVSNKLAANQRKQETETKHALTRLPSVDDRLKGQTNCPACGQDLPSEALAELRKKYEAEADEHLDLANRAMQYLATLEDEEQELLAKIDKLNSEVAKLETELSVIGKIPLQLARLQSQMDAHRREHDKWRKEADLANANVTKVANEPCPLTVLIQAVEIELKRDNEALEAKHAENSKLRLDLRYLEYWRNGFHRSGMPSLVLDTVTPYLSDRANHYLKTLTNGAAQVRFSTITLGSDGGIRDVFNVAAGYSLGGSSYEGISDGERRRVDIAVLLALGDLAASQHREVYLRLLDEPFEKLDDTGLESVLRCLRQEVVPRVGTILFTTHTEEVKALSDNRIVVVKEHGISRIEDA